MLEPLVAIVAAITACAISRYIDPGINIRMVVLSAIIVFIPGLGTHIRTSRTLCSTSCVGYCAYNGRINVAI